MTAKEKVKVLIEAFEHVDAEFVVDLCEKRVPLDKVVSMVIALISEVNAKGIIEFLDEQYEGIDEEDLPDVETIGVTINVREVNSISKGLLQIHVPFDYELRDLVKSNTSIEKLSDSKSLEELYSDLKRALQGR